MNNINGHFLIETKQVNVDHFKLGQAQVKAEIKKNQIFINQIEIEHPSGMASLKEIEIEQKSPFNFKAKMKVNHFDLQKLFVSIGLPDIQAGLVATGESACSGLLDPDFKITCQVDSELKDIWVKADAKSNLHILKLKKASLKGQLQANLQGIQYKTDLRVGESKGSSQGQVSFSEGFNLNYETEKLSFNDVESLADLNFKGDLKIKGTTSGNSSFGLIDAEAVFSNGEIDRFKIGRLESTIKYKNGQLELNQMNGLIGKSTYQGDLAFDFKKSTLASHLDLKTLSGEDLLTALNERFDIPFNLSGTGQAQIDVTGPFDFWKLSYVLKAQLNQGQIAGEGFEKLHFNLKANGEKIHLDQVDLKKSKSLVILEGDILTQNKEPQFNVQIKAQPFLLEESDQMTKLTPRLSGQAWVEGQIKKDLLNPEVIFNFNIKQMSFENTEYPGSQGQITIDKNNLKFIGQLFGRQIQSDLVWPWNIKDPLALRLQVRDLNPLMLLPLISLPQPSNEFYSRLNMDIDLKSNQRSLKNSEGHIRINDFMLQRGALYLKLNKTSNLFFKNGLSQMDPIDFKGENNSLHVNYINSKKDEVRLTVAGDVQLKQFQFLVPFAQTLGGRLQVDSQILFRGNEFELLGDGEVTDGLVNLKGFPQAIENINTPIEFSKSKIILSDITAQLGSSEISGQGQIDIKGQHQINVNLQASAENIELTFPDQITTAGKADLLFFGNWLPYTLKVNYKVARGLVEKDFGQDSSQNKAALKASPYLPPQQIESQAPSLLIDVAIDLSQGVIVKNQIMEGEAFGKLQVNGTPENPKILGRIDIKPRSKLIFRDKAFDIQTATIQFPPGPDINPDIYMTASSRVSDYDINLLVTGSAKNLSIKPSSQPPLSEPDIFSLLALGLTSSKLDQNLSSDTQREKMGLEILASQVNQSQVNKKFQEKFGLTVQLNPTVDSTKNIAVPKVVVSKKIQKNLNASYSRPLTGDTQNQEWKLQYLFNPNKSMILNYQNIETNQQNQLSNTNTTDQGILGLDFEYKKEFK
jgi:translocation and assembly module TamB